LAKLTAKQERFCQEYIIDCNGTQAAIRASYSEKTAGVIACEHLKKPKIQARIAELQERMAKVAGLSAEYVLEGYMDIYQRCMQAVPITDANGAPSGFTFNAAGANKALEMLGKHLALFEGKLATEQKQVIEIVLSTSGNDKVDPLAERLTGVLVSGDN